MEASTEVSPAEHVPAKPQRRTWTVEIAYKNGSVDREVVKAFTRETAYKLGEGDGGGPVYLVEGEHAHVVASVVDVMRIRVS